MYSIYFYCPWALVLKQLLISDTWYHTSQQCVIVGHSSDIPVQAKETIIEYQPTVIYNKFPIYILYTYFNLCPSVLSSGRTSLRLRLPPVHPSRVGRGQPPPQGWTISPRLSEKCGSPYRRTDVWWCGHAIDIMVEVEMDEMKGLFCVDILVTLEIFPTEAVPRYALYIEKGLVQVCLFLVPGTIG